MLTIFSFIYWLPALVVIILLPMCWYTEILTPKTGLVFVAWFLVALGTQWFARSPGMWTSGLIMQVVLAITLSVKWKLEGIDSP